MCGACFLRQPLQHRHGASQHRCHRHRQTLPGKGLGFAHLQVARAQARAQKEASAAETRAAREEAQRAAREQREAAAQAARVKSAAVRTGTNILSQVGREVVRSIFGTSRRR